MPAFASDHRGRRAGSRIANPAKGLVRVAAPLTSCEGFEVGLERSWSAIIHLLGIDDLAIHDDGWRSRVAVY